MKTFEKFEKKLIIKTMKERNNLYFESLQNVIKDLQFNYDESKFETSEKLTGYWIETVGNKISQFSKVLEFSTDNILTIVCSDSFVANELYLEKNKLTKLMNEKTKNLGIEIKDIRFNYKKWKEQK